MYRKINYPGISQKVKQNTHVLEIQSYQCKQIMIQSLLKTNFTFIHFLDVEFSRYMEELLPRMLNDILSHEMVQDTQILIRIPRGKTSYFMHVFIYAVIFHTFFFIIIFFFLVKTYVFFNQGKTFECIFYSWRKKKRNLDTNNAMHLPVFLFSM